MDVRRVRTGAIAVTLALAIPSLPAVAVPAAPKTLVAYLGTSAGTSAGFRSPSVGAPWSTDAAHTIPDAGSSAFPVLVKLDGDGDHDALVGEGGGTVRAFRNNGSDSAPLWTRNTAWDAGIDVGSQAAPAALDLDGDGDFDLLVGNSSGAIIGVENTGAKNAPKWTAKPAWNMTVGGSYPHPAAADFDRDGNDDVVFGLAAGNAIAFRGTGTAAAPLTRAVAWDAADIGAYLTPGAADVDGDGKVDLVVVDSGARLVAAFRNTGNAFAKQTSWVAALDAGSGPGGIALTTVTADSTTTTTTTVPTTGPPTTTPTTGPGGNRAPVARIAATPDAGTAPLTVTIDATRSSDADGDTLSYTFDFGDGSAPPPVADPAAAITAAKSAYDAADGTRERGSKGASIPMYLGAAHKFHGLTGITATSPFSAHNGSLKTIDKVSRYYLMKIGHDLGAVYLYNSSKVHGLDGCDRYQTSYLYTIDAVKQAQLGGFGSLTDSNGTAGNRTEAIAELNRAHCSVPTYREMFVPPSHVYSTPGTYTAKVTVSDGKTQSTATTPIVVRTRDGDPPPVTTTTQPPVTTTTTTPPRPGIPPSPAFPEPLEGFGAATRAGSRGTVIVVSEPTTAAVKHALAEAKKNSDAGQSSRIAFATRGPIPVTSPLKLTANNVTVEGNGVTLVGSGGLGEGVSGMFGVYGHDVIVRDMRLRDGGDNLRVQGPGAYNVVLSHISSTGAMDDGLSIGYGAHDVTLQYSFFAGNTRSIFIKYKGVDRITLHHNWVMKQWIRGPLVNGAFVDLRNNVVEDWKMWGVRYESDATGNAVNNLFGYGAFANGKWGKRVNGLKVDSEGVYVAGNEFRGSAAPGPDAAGTATAPNPSPPVSTQSVAAMEPTVRAKAGAMPRDAADNAYITLPSWDNGDRSPVRLPRP